MPYAVSAAVISGGTREATREFPSGAERWRSELKERLRTGNHVACKRMHGSRHGWPLRIRRDSSLNALHTNALPAQRAANARQLSNTRVALPLNLRHLARNNIDLKWAKVTDAQLPPLHRNDVVTRRQRNPKLSLVVRGKRRHLRFQVFHHESSIRKRLEIGSIRSGGTRLTGTNRDDSFDS